MWSGLHTPIWSCAGCTCLLAARRYGWPLPLAFLIAILTVAGLGVLVHLLIIAPILGSAPINQLLATGGLLYFLQSFATLLFGTDFRNIGVRLPIIELGDHVSQLFAPDRLAVALVGAVALYLFLKRTYVGTAIRAISQDRDVMGLMGVDQRTIYIATSAIGGALAGLAACLLALQYDVHPFIGITFGPLMFMICVLGGLGNMIGGFIASFIISQIISIGGYYASTEWAYVLAFMLFIVLMFICPRGSWRDEHDAHGLRCIGVALLALCAARHHALFPASLDPDPALGLYLHGLGPDGPVRLRLARAWRLHGDRRLCAGAVVELQGLTPWIGIPLGVALAVLLRWPSAIRASGFKLSGTISRW